VIGALQGAEAARLLAGQTPAFAGRLIQYDSASMTLRSVRFQANPSCAVCGEQPRIVRLDGAAYPAVACI
jgi:adenylyltransferase/sulfurtransferase